MMSPADIANLNIPDTFGSFDGYDISPEMEDVMDQLESDVSTVWGATKFVIIFDKEVVKIPFNGMYDYEGDEFTPFIYNDYCAIEADLYDKAEDAGIEYFFAKTEYAGMTVSRTPYYISEKVYEWDSNEKNNRSRKPSEKSIEKAEEFYSNKNSIWIDNYWIALAYEYYGEKAVKKFVDFVEDNEISDFHGGNLGIREDGSPCILDYSSYLEQ